MIDAAPDYCEPIIGWRAWRAVQRKDDVHLMSLFHRVRWPAGEALNGKCEVWQPRWWGEDRRHPPPTSDCTCGIYAATLETASAYAPAFLLRTRRRVLPVLGTVALWGDVLEYTEGWRASYAYPTHLYVLFAHDARAGRARWIAEALRRYGVPVDVVRARTAREVVTALTEAAPELAFVAR